MDFKEASQLVNKYYPKAQITEEYFKSDFNYWAGHSIIMPDRMDELYELPDSKIFEKWLVTCKQERFEDFVQKKLIFPSILIMEKVVYVEVHEQTNTQNKKVVNIQEFLTNQKKLVDENSKYMFFMPNDGICWSCHRQIIPRLIEKGQDGSQELVTGCPLCNKSYVD